MALRRYLRPESIRLTMETRAEPLEGEYPTSQRYLERIREAIIREITDMFAETGKIGNPSRLLTDLLNREKRASTAIGLGIALPHVRTLQAKDFLMVFARSKEGLPFLHPDGELVHLFFGLVAPPYEDRTYLRVYRTLALVLREEVNRERLLTAEDPSEILRTLEQLEQ